MSENSQPKQPVKSNLFNRTMAIWILLLSLLGILYMQRDNSASEQQKLTIFEFISTDLSQFKIPELNKFYDENEIYSYFITLFNMNELKLGEEDEKSVEFVNRLTNRVSELSNGKVRVIYVDNKENIKDEIEGLRFSNSLREIFLKIESLETNENLYIQIAPASNGFIAYKQRSTS